MADVYDDAFWNAIDGDIDGLKNIVRADLLDAWFAPAPGVLAALSKHLSTICNTSPERGAATVAKEIAEWRGVPEECVLLGAGSSSLNYAAIPRWLAGCRTAAVLKPTSAEYPRLLSQIGVETVEIPAELTPELPEEIQQADAAVIVNPNSPTGTTCDGNTLVASLPDDKRLWIDETYLEFAEGETSAECFAAEKPNVVVVKSLSKVLALSGLRIGYLVGHPDTIRELRRYSPPWPLSLPGQVATLEAIRDPSYYQNRYSDTREAVHDLAQSLGGSETRINCVLVQVAKPDETLMRLRAEGVYVRHIGDGVLRVSVRPRPEMWRLISAFHKVLPLLGN